MSAVQPSYVGVDMVLAYNSIGSPWGSTTLVVIGAKDVKRGRQATKADVSNRKSRKKLSAKGMVDEEITFDMVYDETAADFVFLRAAFEAGTPVQFWFGNGPLGTGGTVASGGTANVVYNTEVMIVVGMDEDQPLDNGCDVSFTIAPAYASIAHADLNNALLA